MRSLLFKSFTHTSGISQKCQARGRQRTVIVKAVDWDPEKLFGPPEPGLINRRMVQKQMQGDKQFAATIQKVQDEVRKEVMTRRAIRNPPSDAGELVEYMLNTEAEDMEYEVARCRPLFTEQFLRHLDNEIGRIRFSPKPDEDRLAEMEALRDYLNAAVKAVDVAVVKTSGAAERMKKLLQAPDKKAAILEMAENNEIDQGLIALLQQNIDAARLAGMEEPAKFMEKVMVAASKYVIQIKKDEVQMPAVTPKQPKLLMM